LLLRAKHLFLAAKVAPPDRTAGRGVRRPLTRARAGKVLGRASWASYGSPTLALSSKCLARSDKSGGRA